MGSSRSSQTSVSGFWYASGKKLQGAAQGGLAQAAMEQVLDTVLALCPAATFTLENQDRGPSLVWLREHGYGANT